MERILFITVVPPFPDDQGNRVVTKAYMDYFVSRGYCIDVIMQCTYDEKKLIEHFGECVSVYQTSFNEDEASSKVSEWMELVRNQAKEQIEEIDIEYEKEIIRDVYYAANHKHPFSKISNETVIKAKELLGKNKYKYIVCNYTYSLRVVRELKRSMNLPPSIVIAHDALSRLDAESLYYDIPTYGLACSQDTERDCLNEADIICAISKYEKDYFHDMNPAWNVILVEYPSWNNNKETVKETSFDRKQIVFFGSGNGPNTKGINEFLENSWQDIKRQIPNVKLVIAGKICNKIQHADSSVILLGRLSEEELWSKICESTIGINPVYIGTGLKIKSVDMMCAGLPFVSFPIGIEGVEELDNFAFETAEDWQQFTKKTVMLLNDFNKWNHNRIVGGDKSRERFSPDYAYKELSQELNYIKLNAD